MGFDFFLPKQNSTPLHGNTADLEKGNHLLLGPESCVDDDASDSILLPLILTTKPDHQNDATFTVTTPKMTTKPQENGGFDIAKKVRPTTLTFLEEKCYNFIDVDVEVVEIQVDEEQSKTKQNEEKDEEADALLLPPLLETTL